MAEHFLSTSHPNNILKGNPLATKNTVVIFTPLLFRSRKTCFFTDLFCRPVAPSNIILLTGKVGTILLHSLCICSNSVLFINETLAPVSIIILVGIPSTRALI